MYGGCEKSGAGRHTATTMGEGLVRSLPHSSSVLTRDSMLCTVRNMAG